MFLSESVIFKLGQFRADFGLGGAELEAPVVDALNVLLVLNVERRVDDLVAVVWGRQPSAPIG